MRGNGKWKRSYHRRDALFSNRIYVCRDSSIPANYDEKDSKERVNVRTNETTLGDEDAVANRAPADISAVEPSPALRRSPSLHRSPSICVEDYSERSNPSLVSAGEPAESSTRSEAPGSGDVESQKSKASGTSGILSRHTPGGESAGSSASKDCNSPANSSRRASQAGSSRCTSPAGSSAGARTPAVADSPSRAPRGSRDVRTALAECIVPARHEDWEAILTGLVETERLAADPEARASPTSWRAATRATAAHVRSLRSRVARTACQTLGALYEHRGRALDSELDEAVAALLERCADANRFLRADAASALGRVACSGTSARAAVALCRRGATHRAGPVRAAAAAALARLVAREGASRTLALPGEARAVLLRAAGELLGDASADARSHARALCLLLSEDARFRPLLKEAMAPTRYRSIEKLVEKLR